MDVRYLFLDKCLKKLSGIKPFVWEKNGQAVETWLSEINFQMVPVIRCIEALYRPLRQGIWRGESVASGSSQRTKITGILTNNQKTILYILDLIFSCIDSFPKEWKVTQNPSNRTFSLSFMSGGASFLAINFTSALVKRALANHHWTFSVDSLLVPLNDNQTLDITHGLSKLLSLRYRGDYG